MDQKLIDFNRNLRTKKIPDLKPGDAVRIHKKIKEGDKERIQVFRGLIIAIKGKQSSSPTITVRRESQGIGVEMTIPVYLPTIEKIEVLRHSKVRRAKLYYMRDRSGKSAKMKVQELAEYEKKVDKEPEMKEEIANETEIAVEKSSEEAKKKIEKNEEEKAADKTEKGEETKE